MAPKKKSINFGEISHFQYVWLCSLCADLGFSVKNLVEEGCWLFFSIVDDEGVSQLEMLSKEYERYKETRERHRYLPRMSEEKHNIVVNDIHEEICDYLSCVKDENGWSWRVWLTFLMMLLELDRNKMDHEAWKQWIEEEDQRTVKEWFDNHCFSFEGTKDSMKIERTRKRKKYDDRVGRYPERRSI